MSRISEVTHGKLHSYFLKPRLRKVPESSGCIGSVVRGRQRILGRESSNEMCIVLRRKSFGEVCQYDFRGERV